MSNPNQVPRILIVDESRMVRAMLIRHIRDLYDFVKKPMARLHGRFWYSITPSSW